VGLDRDIVGDETDRLLAFEDPQPTGTLQADYFGKPNIYDGFLYEDEFDFLKRLGLLLTSEEGPAPADGR
jgi:hypothetical protein